MKTLGLIGGMSWESTVPYYRLINQAVQAQLGGLHSARLLLASVDFAEVEVLQARDHWDEAGALLAGLARTLEQAGAHALVLCTNTMHKVAPAIEQAVGIPLLHIVDPTAAAIRQAGLHTVGLLGTRFTMEQDFVRQRLQAQGLTVLTPPAGQRDEVHRIIYDELCCGLVRDASRSTYLAAIDSLQAQGAQGVILGCTEIGLLVGPQDCALPLFDTTPLHAQAAARWALGLADE
jgi:aspartate racemase